MNDQPSRTFWSRREPAEQLGVLREQVRARTATILDVPLDQVDIVETPQSDRIDLRAVWVPPS